MKNQSYLIPESQPTFTDTLEKQKKKKKKCNRYSITFRPLYETYKLIKNPYQILLLYGKKHNKYSVGEEKGWKSECFTHIHLTYEKNNNNLQSEERRKLVKFLLSQGVDLKNWSKKEQRIGLKVNQITTNYEDLIGYSQKEQKGGKKSYFGYDEKLMKRSIEMQKMKEDIKLKKIKHRINRNNYHIIVEEFLSINKKLCQPDGYSKSDLQKILDNMLDNGYYLTFINSRNVVDIINYLYSYLNKKPSEYIQNLYKGEQHFWREENRE